MRLSASIGMVSLRLDAEASDARVVRVVNDRGANVWIGGTCVVADAASWRALAALATEAARVEEDCERVRKERG